MSNRTDSLIDRTCAFLITTGLLLGSVGLLAFALGGCSADKDRPRSVDLGVKGSYIPGSAIGTRNQPPQGGIDEKSGSTPAGPLD